MTLSACQEAHREKPIAKRQWLPEAEKMEQDFDDHILRKWTKLDDC